MGKQIKGILGTKLRHDQVFNDAGQIVRSRWYRPVRAW